MKIKHGHLYILKDPINLEVRYVGKWEKENIFWRLQRHIADSKKIKIDNTYYANHYTARWIRSLLDKNLQPLIVVIQKDYRNREDLCSDEKMIISLYKHLGVKLTNTAEGGLGGSGPCSEETRKKLSSINMGNTFGLGKKLSPETRSKISQKNKGKKRSFEMRRKISQDVTKRFQDPDERKKISRLRGCKGSFVDELNNTYETFAEAGKKLNLIPSNIGRFLNLRNNRKHVGGHTFRYLTEQEIELLK